VKSFSEGTVRNILEMNVKKALPAYAAKKLWVHDREVVLLKKIK